MKQTLDWVLADEPVMLHASKALYLPRWSTLLVADTHFGKGAFFRRQGIAVPSGQSADDLRRLSTLVDQFEPQRLIVLGDVFHHRPAAGEPFFDHFDAWQARHRQLTMEAVVGNHDRHVRGLSLPIDWHPLLDIGPFRLCHEPEAVKGRHVIAGHIHPAYALAAGGDRLRAPVFWMRPGVTVLPSFGALTGGWNVPEHRDSRMVMVLDDQLLPLPEL
ncbi:ligase-associated DNA damage response endonuclease PdeM [Halopseudomonas nanhaiensis]|uniref:ligase-associated DNA damage response endonuclease PdeM n=1 Tax=Halopseudomonas nanhaiensis TaxID=2830842 RepID=UPI001CBCF217|nr:ligase-associated DNA damage response endonuclease PdeM [Halopseudomonas nanhaiensis]UAW98487.1 ligase-associated DNA damage response endonuclease PdeM [Halopseudomonas nanhaiensis]